MLRARFDDLSELVQAFLQEVPPEGTTIVDENGQMRFSIVRFVPVSAEDQAKSLASLRELQRTFGDRMRADGRRPEELDRLIE